MCVEFISIKLVWENQVKKLEKHTIILGFEKLLE